MRCKDTKGAKAYINDFGVVDAKEWWLGLTPDEIRSRLRSEYALAVYNDVDFEGGVWEEYDSKQEAVRKFHKKHGFTIGVALEPWSRVEDDLLGHAASTLETLEAQMHRLVDRDVRCRRAQLVLEEVGELMDALQRCNRVAIADALGDIVYVVYGTAVTYDINLSEVFNRIDVSNMSKDVGGHKPTGGHKPELNDV